MVPIHVLDDDQRFAEAMRTIIEQRGDFKVRVFLTPHEFFYELGKLPPRCALIDWSLPEMSGIDVIKRIRKLVGQKIGLMMVTSLASEDNVVTAFAAGADDYLIKPTGANVMMARLDALVRRISPSNTPPVTIELGPYVFDYARQSVWFHAKQIELTPREFDLAWTFFEAPSRLFTKQELLASIWGKSERADVHTIAQHIYSIRKKLDFMVSGFGLTPVYGVGYRLEVPAQSASRPGPEQIGPERTGLVHRIAE
jgi:two-component system, OmpR family, phosphate regulon response regulator PhoB